MLSLLSDSTHQIPLLFHLSEFLMLQNFKAAAKIKPIKWLRISFSLPVWLFRRTLDPLRSNREKNSQVPISWREDSLSFDWGKMVLKFHRDVQKNNDEKPFQFLFITSFLYNWISNAYSSVNELNKYLIITYIYWGLSYTRLLQKSF